jgi:hypothetical protein
VTQAKAIQSTAAIEIRHERLSRWNSHPINHSAYIMHREMNIPMIRIICGDEQGIRVPEKLHTSWGVWHVSDYSICILCMDQVRFCHKIIMGMTSRMGWV